MRGMAENVYQKYPNAAEKVYQKYPITQEYPMTQEMNSYY